jgi:hypothetical protein
VEYTALHLLGVNLLQRECIQPAIVIMEHRTRGSERSDWK